MIFAPASARYVFVLSLTVLGTSYQSPLALEVTATNQNESSNFL